MRDSAIVMIVIPHVNRYEISLDETEFLLF